MTLNLTPGEYRSLLKVVFLGNWMANAYRETPLPEFDNVEQLIMSRASTFGADELVEFDPKKKVWALKREFEDEMHEQVNEYNIEALYDELGYWLARRDLVNEIGEGKAEQMTPAGLASAAEPYLEKYDEEFEENGIERIGIIPDLPVRGE
jgi:hypothetical protein